MSGGWGGWGGASSDHFSGFAPCEPLWAAGGHCERTSLVEGLALEQVLLPPLTLLLGLLDPSR